MVVVSLAGLILQATAARAQPASFPANSQYTATTCGTQKSRGPASDGGAAKKERDIVGDKIHPALLLVLLLFLKGRRRKR